MNNVSKQDMPCTQEGPSEVFSTIQTIKEAILFLGDKIKPVCLFQTPSKAATVPNAVTRLQEELNEVRIMLGELNDAIRL